jgi:hypothetical protein
LVPVGDVIEACPHGTTLHIDSDLRNQALTWRAEWRAPVYLDRGYFAFLASDLSEGTFGTSSFAKRCTTASSMQTMQDVPATQRQQ